MNVYLTMEFCLLYQYIIIEAKYWQLMHMLPNVNKYNTTKGFVGDTYIQDQTAFIQ